MEEVNLSTATLMAAAPFVGLHCEAINNEFMLCRLENPGDPRRCLELGKFVTSCTMEIFRKIKAKCLHEFNQYANCVDKSSGDYKPWPCRKTMHTFDECMRLNYCMQRPHFGYFTRGRIHKAGCTPAPPAPPCPCHQKVKDPTPSLPDCKPRQTPRFSSRYFWVIE